MNQIVSWLAIFSVSLVITVPIVVFSEQKIFDSSKSVLDLARDAEIRTSQEIVVNHFQKNNGNTMLKIANTGLYNVTIFTILVNGAESTWTLTDQSSNAVETIIPGQLATIDISNAVGDSVQIITNSGKLFEIDTT